MLELLDYLPEFASMFLIFWGLMVKMEDAPRRPKVVYYYQI